jgi:hypothetical protein
VLTPRFYTGGFAGGLQLELENGTCTEVNGPFCDGRNPCPATTVTCIDLITSGDVTGGYDARCDFFTPCPVYVVDGATAGGYKLHPATVSN